MKLSIIMPAYNAEKHIGETIKSVLVQTFTNFELIIINDGSRDETENIIKAHQTIDDRIKYYYIKNSGSAVARNVGLEHASGDYIGFVDSDDLIDKYMYETLIKNAGVHDVDIVGASYEKIEGNNVIPEETYFPKGYYDKENIIKCIYPVLIAPTDLFETFSKNIWSKIFRKELIKKNEISFSPNLRMSQDVIFTMGCMLNANSFYYLPDDKLYKYIYNQESRTNTYLLDSWSIMKDNFFETKKLVDKNPYKVLKEQLPYAIVRNAMGSIKNEGMNTKKVSNKQQLKNIKEILNEEILCENINFLNIKEFSNTRRILYFLIKHKNVNSIFFLSKLYNSLNYRFK